MEATFLTLAARPIGAFIFGSLADRFGRKPTLMWNILAFSILEGASGFAPSLMTIFGVRFLFGIAMGGEWGHRFRADVRNHTDPRPRRGVGSVAGGLS